MFLQKHRLLDKGGINENLSQSIAEIGLYAQMSLVGYPLRKEMLSPRAHTAKTGKREEDKEWLG